MDRGTMAMDRGKYLTSTKRVNRGNYSFSTTPPKPQHLATGLIQARATQDLADTNHMLINLWKVCKLQLSRPWQYFSHRFPFVRHFYCCGAISFFCIISSTKHWWFWRMIAISGRHHLCITILTAFMKGVHCFQPNRRKGSWHWKGWKSLVYEIEQSVKSTLGYSYI